MSITKNPPKVLNTFFQFAEETELNLPNKPLETQKVIEAAWPRFYDKKRTPPKPRQTGGAKKAKAQPVEQLSKACVSMLDEGEPLDAVSQKVSEALPVNVKKKMVVRSIRASSLTKLIYAWRKQNKISSDDVQRFEQIIDDMDATSEPVDAPSPSARKKAAPSAKKKTPPSKAQKQQQSESEESSSDSENENNQVNNNNDASSSSDDE